MRSDRDRFGAQVSVTFVPVMEEDLVEIQNAYGGAYIKALIIDESGPGVEIRIMSDGEVISRPLAIGEGVEHYRSATMWEEVVDGSP